MLIPHGTLVAVLDGAKLELFRNDGRETTLTLSALPTPKLDAHSSDKHHHGSSANPDHHAGEEDAFASAVAHWLNHEALANKFEHLVVVAAPKALGELRRGYHNALKDKLIGELAKEMTGRPPAEIEHELKVTHVA